MLNRLPPVTPALYRKITLFALIAQVFIMVTGAAVRLTGSGLGCSTWPKCESDSLTPHGESSYHAFVEFGNRTITGLVSVAVALAVLGALRRNPYRRDLVWPAVGLVLGVMAQIVLGGVTVLVDLTPPYVMAHFLLSVVLVVTAVVLHVRAGEPDSDLPRLPIVAPEVGMMSRVQLAAAALVTFTGTVVTGAGPHGGDEKVTRLDFAVPDVARLHGIAENLFLVGVLATLWLLHRTNAPAVVKRDGQILLAVLVAQAAVGYAQYFAGVPALLVGIHVFGVASLWVAVVAFHLRLWRRAESAPAPARIGAYADARSG